MSFCTVPASAVVWHAPAPGDRDVEREQDDGRRVDRHRRRHAVERDAVEELGHVLDAVDRDADSSDFSLGQRMVRVVAHLGRQVEGDAEAGDALCEKVPIPPVGFRRRPEPRVLPHRPEAAAVHRGLDAAGEGERAGKPQLGVRIPGRERAGIGEICTHDKKCRHCNNCPLRAGIETRGNCARPAAETTTCCGWNH